MTYGQMAANAGNSKAARAAGYFMRTNHYAPIVPCHRVVAADGSLHGYLGAGGVATKKKMLVEEGVEFKGGKVKLTICTYCTNMNS
jgi:methylated-DNA-[protein]-cysteine S-methyltransferase